MAIASDPSALKGQAVFEAAAAVLNSNRADVPFALIYVLAEQEQQLALAAAVGLETGSAAAPAVVALDTEVTDAAHGWPLAAVVRGSGAVLVDDLPERFGKLPGGPWPESPQQA